MDKVRELLCLVEQVINKVVPEVRVHLEEKETKRFKVMRK